MRARLVDVASLAGVSKGTVSRVINERGYISEETRKKVEKAIKELNYYPNEVARSVSNRKSFVIGAIIPTTNHPFWGEMFYYIERKLNSSGYKLMLCNSLNDVEKENRYLELLLSNQVDGIIVASYNSNQVDYNVPGLPIVAIDYFLSENIPIVSSDNYRGGYLAVQELIRAGCKNIVTINGVKKEPGAINKRFEAYHDMMEKHQLSSYSLELESGLTKEEKMICIEQFIEKHPYIDGVFAQDDETASYVLQNLEQLQRRVPEDVKVVGYDGTETVRQLLPDLTTIMQPIEDMASTAVDILMNRMDKKEVVKKDVVLPVSLIKGVTTARK